MDENHQNSMKFSKILCLQGCTKNPEIFAEDDLKKRSPIGTTKFTFPGSALRRTFNSAGKGFNERVFGFSLSCHDCATPRRATDPKLGHVGTLREFYAVPLSDF